MLKTLGNKTYQYDNNYQNLKEYKFNLNVESTVLDFLMVDNLKIRFRILAILQKHNK